MLWDKSTVYEPSVNDDELMYSARKERYASAPLGPYNPSSGQKRSRLQKPAAQQSNVPFAS